MTREQFFSECCSNTPTEILLIRPADRIPELFREFMDDLSENVNQLVSWQGSTSFNVGGTTSVTILFMDEDSEVPLDWTQRFDGIYETFC